MGGASSRYKFTVLRDRIGAHPGRVLDFALGRHREPPPPHVLELMRRSPDLALEKCPRDEMDAFHAAAAAMLARVYGARVPAASIVAAPGGRGAISALAAVCIAPGDGVVVTEPGYPAFARVAAQHHARVSVVRLDPDRGFDPEPGGLDELAPTTARVLALNYPNNPTGAVPSAAALATYGRAAGRDTLWFNDAAYGPLTWHNPPFSLLAADGAALAGASIVELHTLAKLYGLGAVAVAFLAGDEDVIGAVRDYSDFAVSPMSTLHVRVGRACLEDTEHLARLAEAVGARLARLRSVLVELGFDVFPTHGGMYALCACPESVGGRPVRSAAEAAEVLLSEHGVAVAPWDLPPHAYLRFSAMYTEPDLDALVALAGGGPLVS